MTATKRPFGLQPVKVRGNAPNSNGLSEYLVGVSSLDDIGRNDCVAMVSGYVQRLSGTRPFGVVTGFKWVDTLTKRPVWSNNVPAGTSSADSRVLALVVDDPDAIFAIQADATVSQGDVGFNFTLSAVGSVNGVGLSQAVMRVAGRTSGVATVRMLGIYDIPGNALGDAFPIVEVQLVAPLQYTTSVS